MHEPLQGRLQDGYAVSPEPSVSRPRARFTVLDLQFFENESREHSFVRNAVLVKREQTASKRLIGNGLLWPDTESVSVSMELLRAHFVAEDALIGRAFEELGYQLPVWKDRYRNSGGDLTPLPEILVEEPDAKEMERLFGSDQET